MASRTHQGLVRLRNEDWVHADAAAGCAILADGMGGLQAGQIASRTAVEAAIQALQQSDDLQEVVNSSHTAVLRKADELGLAGKMGTTLSILRLEAGTYACGHIGDSRIYQLFDGRLQQLTTDHTLARRMIDLGMVEEDDKVNERNNHVLTQAVGIPGEFEPEVTSGEVGGRFLLCSDGLSDLVSDEQIADILEIVDLEECVDILVKAALDRGGRDNISVVVIESSP